MTPPKADGEQITALGSKPLSSIYMAWMRALAVPCLVVLAGTAVARASAQDLSQFMGSSPPCAPGTTATPALAPDGTFKAGAPLRAVLADPAAGPSLTLTGTISGLRCGRIAGAEIDMWQADASGRYDMRGYTLRGRQITDKDGGYRFVTIVPGTAGRRARHVSLRVRVAGHPDLFTEAFFPDDPARARDPRFREELLLHLLRAPDGSRAATFDIWLDM
jgi:protocatechuate 3,4-dioxygenase beta subunit